MNAAARCLAWSGSVLQAMLGLFLSTPCNKFENHVVLGTRRTLMEYKVISVLWSILGLHPFFPTITELIGELKMCFKYQTSVAAPGSLNHYMK